ncbi:MAG: DUF2892 domain-containing protein [Colwellia sp.]|nr:DUF2892 domain-containing protein [Colwellia sp.]
MKTPKINLCAIDRVFRGIISVVLIIYSIFYYEQIGDIFLVSLIWIFSALNLISFAIGWCPVYHLANISTCKSKED